MIIIQYESINNDEVKFVNLLYDFLRVLTKNDQEKIVNLLYDFLRVLTKNDQVNFE